MKLNNELNGLFWEYEQIPTHKALEVNYREISSGEEALVFEQDVRYVKDPIFVVFPFEAMSFDELDLYMGNGEVLFFGDKAALAQAPHDFGLDVLDYKVREPAADALTLLNERMAALHQLIFKLSVYAILLVFVSLVFGVCNVLARRQQLSVQHLIGYGPKDKHGRLLAFLGMFSGGVLLMHFAFQGKIDGIFTAFMRLFISEPLDIVDVIYLLQTVLAILSYGVLIATLLIAEKRLRLTSKRL